MIKLYNFFNSSAAYRVRIALGLKGLLFTPVSVNLRAGEHCAQEYTTINPTQLLPTLEDDGYRVIESLAIIDYLDRRYPTPLMVPPEGPERDRVLEIANLIACDMHPLNNLRVLNYLTVDLGLDAAQKRSWIFNWLSVGFASVEAMLPDHDNWCCGGQPTLADCCLVPQVANARRAAFALDRYPRIERISRFCELHPAFKHAAPSAQPDFVVAH